MILFSRGRSAGFHCVTQLVLLPLSYKMYYFMQNKPIHTNLPDLHLPQNSAYLMLYKLLSITFCLCLTLCVTTEQEQRIKRLEKIDVYTYIMSVLYCIIKYFSLNFHHITEFRMRQPYQNCFIYSRPRSIVRKESDCWDVFSGLMFLKQRVDNSQSAVMSLPVLKLEVTFWYQSTTFHPSHTHTSPCYSIDQGLGMGNISGRLPPGMD